MIINHPLLGPRDAAEFTYFGDASLIDRPNGAAKNPLPAFIDYVTCGITSLESIVNYGFMNKAIDHGWL